MGKKLTLYDFCLESLAGDKSTELKHLIESSGEGIKKNDLIYALFLQTNILQESVNFMHKMQGIRHGAIIKEINELLEKNKNDYSEKIKCDQAGQTIAIRRLASTLNERKLIKAIVLIIAFLLILISSFFFCSLAFRKSCSNKAENPSNIEFLKMHKEISDG